ncbi:MAG: AAA family ATPase [Gemmatimonadetes bacterium]|nr:AAA family ATPase [Gemmatimonadota bacterium]
MAFVGREAELDLLAREAALALEISSGRSLFIDGPPGAGKTALATEFLERLAAERPGLAIARGRCLQTFGSADPYLPFVDALKDLSDDRTSGFVGRETLSGLLTELAPYWLSVVPLVGGVLSAGFATAARLRGQAPAAAAPSREALFVQYLEVIKGLAANGPLVLFLDDLHWSDQSSIALLSHVSRGIANLPVVILGTLRGTDAELEKLPIREVIRELMREDLARQIQVDEMPEESILPLLAAEFGGDVSEPLARWMRETAGGNPLFVSELSRLLKQNGGAVETNGEWLLTPAVKDFEVPQSVEAVVESRIQRLDADEVRILQYASVEGNEFNSTVVSQLLDADELEVLDALEKMERRYALVQTTGEIELPDGDFATTFRFRHALAQTVLYRQVVGKRRILLHRKAAEALETMFQASLDDVAGKLARHFHEGRQKDSAHRYARLAADRARRVHAHWEAEELFRVALENSPDEADRADIRERLGDVYDVVGYYSSGIECYRMSLQTRNSDRVASWRLRRKILVLERKAGLIPAPELLQQVRTLLSEGVDDVEERCYLLLETSMLPNAVGVVESVQEAVELAESRGEPLLVLDALERLAYVLIFFGGRIEEAFPHLQRSLEIAREMGDPLRSERSHEVRAVAHAKLGRYAEALQEFQGALGMAERLGEPRRIGTVCNNLGTLLLRLGRYGEAEEILQRARLIHERRDRATLVHSVLNLAERARCSGDLPLAIERYQQLLAYAREFEYWTSEAVAQAGLGLSLLAAGRVQEAREAAWGAISVLADHEEWFEDREFVEILLARLDALDGHLDQAAERLGRAAGVLSTFDVYPWAVVELQRVRILMQRAPDTAHSVLSDVIAATSGVQSALEQEITELMASLDGNEMIREAGRSV